VRTQEAGKGVEYKVIYEYDEDVLRQAANLHYQTLAYRSFITSFGQDFLYELYKGILGSHLGIFIFTSADSRLKGFILGCTNSQKLISIIFKRFWIFGKLIIPVVLRNPVIIKKLITTIFYPQKEGVKTKGELLVIVVEPDSRSRGIGSMLLKKLDEEFRKHGICEYKVTVHKEMMKSNHFYLKNGMKLLRTFNLYDTAWNIYSRNIGHEGKI